MSRMQLYITILSAVALAWLLTDTEACFITNCPRGKRSFMSVGHFGSGSSMQKECTRCGPGLMGRCYGANICCSPLTGCSIGGPLAARCSLEAFTPVLCLNPGQACGGENKGVCALNSTCCTSDGCFNDKTCQVEESSF